MIILQRHEALKLAREHQRWSQRSYYHNANVFAAFALRLQSANEFRLPVEITVTPSTLRPMISALIEDHSSKSC